MISQVSDNPVGVYHEDRSHRQANICSYRRRSSCCPWVYNFRDSLLHLQKLAIPAGLYTRVSCPSLQLRVETTDRFRFPRPCLSSCIFGLFNVIYNLSIHRNSVPRWNASSIVAVTLAAASTLIYLIFALITYRSIHTVRSRDAMHRHNSDGEALLPEDEMQRQQLLRLLLHKDGKKVSSEASRSTYRIDLPDTIRRVTTHLSAPQNVYGIDTRPSRSRSAPIEPFQDRAGGQTSPEPPTVHIHEPTLTTNSTYPQVQYTQDTYPASSDYEPNFNHYPQNTFLPAHTYQTNTDDYPQDPHSPADGYASHQSDLGIEGLVNTHPRTPSLPIEKQEQLTRQLSARHPAERASYHIVDPPVPQVASYYTPQSVEELNRLSRESRRMEIELEDRGRDKKRRADVKIDGVEFTPRINRVVTDGWGRP